MNQFLIIGSIFLLLSGYDVMSDGEAKMIRQRVGELASMPDRTCVEGPKYDNRPAVSWRYICMGCGKERNATLCRNLGNCGMKTGGDPDHDALWIQDNSPMFPYGWRWVTAAQFHSPESPGYDSCWKAFALQ